MLRVAYQILRELSRERAVFVQLDVVFAAREELNADLIFRFLHTPAERGLRYQRVLRRGGERPGL